jgi:hypothetical protein
MNDGDEEQQKKEAEDMKKLRSDAPDAEFAEKTSAEQKDRQA